MNKINFTTIFVSVSFCAIIASVFNFGSITELRAETEETNATTTVVATPTEPELPPATTTPPEIDVATSTDEEEEDDTTQNTATTTVQSTATTTVQSTATSTDPGTQLGNVISAVDILLSSTTTEATTTKQEVVEEVEKTNSKPPKTYSGVSGVKAVVGVNSRGQRGISILADSVSGIDKTDMASGLVSWSFLPQSISVKDTYAVRSYVFDHLFGFSNNPNDILIDDTYHVDDLPVRIVLVAWECKTTDCDTFEEMSAPIFISKEKINFHKADKASTGLNNDLN